MSARSFLRLIRYKNLLMIVMTQALVKFLLYNDLEKTSLDNIHFFLLVGSMVFLAAAGNIVNDIYDTQADAINKPGHSLVGVEISFRLSWFLYGILNVLGLSIGLYLSYHIERPDYFVFFVLPCLFLFLYAKEIKGTVLVGNLVISIMVGMIILMVGIFDLVPQLAGPVGNYHQLFKLTAGYAFFAFLINFLREIVKDQEDINGDYRAGFRTLPVLIGRERTNKIVFILGLFPLFLLIYYLYFFLSGQVPAVVFALFLIAVPLGFFLYKIPTASSTRHYRHLSRLLKYILLAGIISLGFMVSYKGG